MPQTISEKLKALQQDGVIWKAAKLWSLATHPDAQASSTQKIVELLLCIPAEIKRNSYIERVSASVADHNRDSQERIKKLERQQAQLGKAIEKIFRKKEQTEADQQQMEQYGREEKEVEEQLLKCRNGILPILKGSDLTKLVKEDLAAKEKKKQRQAEIAAEASNSESNEDMGLPADFDGNRSDVVRFGVYKYKGRYFSKNSKGFYDEISNFTMEIVHHVQTSADAAYRLCTLKNVYGIDKMLMINTDDLVSVGNFKKILARQGDFVFKGSDSDLCRLSEYLQRNEKASKVVEVLGYDTRGQFYAFANGVVDTSEETAGNFLAVDEFGLVELRDKHYLIPAMSKMFAEKDGLYVNEKKFVYLENKKMDFEAWSFLHRQVYGNAGIICQMWAIVALFRDIIHGLNEIRATPILCMYGPRGAGKGKCADSIMYLFGVGQSPIALGSHSTPKGFLRKFAQFKNAVVWLDEYKNNIKKDFIEALKNIFDGFSYSRARMSMDFQTEDMPVSSACLLSGQEMPTIEPALFSRCILLQFQPGKDRTDEQRAAFKKLKDEEGNGISSILPEILQHRPAIRQHFANVFDRKQKQLFNTVANRDVDDRFILCISLLATVREVLDPHLRFSFTQEEAEAALVANLREQFAVMQGNDDLGKFWKVIGYLAAEKRIQHGVHYYVADGFIYLKLNGIYGIYYNELFKNRGDANALSEPTLANYLKLDRDTFLDHQKKKKFPGSQTAHWTWMFRYSVLQQRYHLELGEKGADAEGSATYNDAGNGAESWPSPNFEENPF